ncbi:MAG TPA: hypothetical protein VH519_02715 [Hyphomicrobiaceae bacterium]|jgi:hypothetical protein
MAKARLDNFYKQSQQRETETEFERQSRIAATCCAATLLLPVVAGLLVTGLERSGNAAFALLPLVPVPITIIYWIKNTIKALHSIDLSFWKMETTWAPWVGFACSFIFIMATSSILDSPHTPSGIKVLLFLFVPVCCVIYMGFANSKRMNGELAFSLTVLQLLAPVVAFVVLGLLTNNGGKRTTRRPGS